MLPPELELVLELGLMLGLLLDWDDAPPAEPLAPTTLAGSEGDRVERAMPIPETEELVDRDDGPAPNASIMGEFMLMWVGDAALGALLLPPPVS